MEITRTFYIGTSLGNANQARDIAALLQGYGYENTFAWWAAPDLRGVGNENSERWRERAHRDLNGIWDADFVVIILPGGYGAHVELGYALANQQWQRSELSRRVPIFLYAPNGVEQDHKADYACVFHYDEGVTRVVGRPYDLIAAIRKALP